ncbi:NADP-dependent oxidoreductase domain-containing protein [Geopyxis carbonaria]|nr:NADP-dependent oxidoreductase domain-containing protein [Geopyxis carbonaria]
MASQKLSISSTVLLKSGHTMPLLGLGVYQTPAALCPALVQHALSLGYRHIDSATAYRNEAACAAGIVASGIPRSAVFFTTKLPPKLRGYAATRDSIAATLAGAPELGGYIDLYLIHAPYGTREDRVGSWRAMVEAAAAGKVRSLGVSNYGVQHLEELREWQKGVGEEEAGVLSVGQWEVHPWCARRDIREWCERHGVVVQAYSPLVRATRMKEKALVRLAEKHGKTPAQVLVRWSLQCGLVPLPKSQKTERITENCGVYDFELTEEEVKGLETTQYEPCCWDPTKEPL